MAKIKSHFSFRLVHFSAVVVSHLGLYLLLILCGDTTPLLYFSSCSYHDIYTFAKLTRLKDLFSETGCTENEITQSMYEVHCRKNRIHQTK
jgi:hypothetical protein